MGESESLSDSTLMEDKENDVQVSSIGIVDESGGGRASLHPNMHNNTDNNLSSSKSSLASNEGHESESASQSTTAPAGDDAREVQSASLVEEHSREASSKIPSSRAAQPAGTLKIRQFQVEVGGKASEIAVIGFANRVMISVAQGKKLGSWMSASADLGYVAGATQTAYTIKTLLGHKNPMEDFTHSFVRALTQRLVDLGELRPILVATGFHKGTTLEEVKTLLDVVMEHYPREGQ